LENRFGAHRADALESCPLPGDQILHAAITSGRILGVGKQAFDPVTCRKVFD
jgi:hypothetical protein